MDNLLTRDSVPPQLKQPVMSDNAKYIAESRYGMRDDSGKTIESVADILWRVAKVIGGKEREIDFYNMMAELQFLPNTPCLVNAGKKVQQMSACFVLPIEDDMKSIVQTMSDMVLIHKSGGGTGFSFSRLRPWGDYIASSGGTTVGPVSFMQAYNDVTSQIKQGGVRRGANMGMLSIDHPDVLRFAVAKVDEFSLTNFNISLAVTDKFMAKMESDKKYWSSGIVPTEIIETIRQIQANRDVDARLRQTEEEVKKLYEWARLEGGGQDEGYELINPRIGQVTMRLNAYKVWCLITRLAWQYGDPGLVFIDRMNEPRSNPVPHLGRIEATNPCGEQPLLPYDACNLGSINLSKFVSEADLNWVELAKVVGLAVEFLDNVVEKNQFPVDKIREMVSKTRRIGLGVMGFADMLFKLGVAYDSPEAEAWAEKVMAFIDQEAKKMSVELAKTRGVFPAWADSVYGGTEYRPRNMALTTIAPTGTISMVADTSSGIEPVFSLGYQKNTVEGKKLFVVNQILVEELKRRGLYSDLILEKIIDNGGKLTDIQELPKEVRKVFRTALEIEPEWHIRIQAAFQKYIDNAVSKTINFARETKVEEVMQAYELAYKMGTKGVTIYRSGSRDKEVLQTVEKKESQLSEAEVKKITKKATPEAARGVRVRKKCDVGNVYTSVFFEAGDGPVEVFVNLGKSGGYLAGAAEVTGRLASLALKYGANLEEVADELVGISCGQKIGMGSGAVLSMFDAVGKTLLEICRGEQLEMFEEEKNVLSVPEVDNGLVKNKLETVSLNKNKQETGEVKFSACPDCGSPLYAEEGCFKCSNGYCGYSKCS